MKRELLINIVLTEYKWSQYIYLLHLHIEYIWSQQVIFEGEIENNGLLHALFSFFLFFFLGFCGLIFLFLF